MSSPDPKAITVIEKRVDEYIRATNVLAGGSIETGYGSTHKALAREVPKHWKNFLGELDVHTIVYTRILRALQDVEVKEKAVLTEVLGAGRVKLLKQDILTFLKSIPRRYYVCFELPAVKLPGMSRIVLTQDVDLFSVSKGDPLPAIRDYAQVNKLAELLAPSPGLNVGKTYVRFHVSGFASWFLDSSALASGYSRFRQLVQLAVSLGLFQGDRSARFYPRSPLSSEVFVYGDPDEPSERQSITLPFSVSHFTATLTLDESKLTVPGGLLLGPDRPALTQEERTAAITRLLQHGLLLLDADDSDESANAIRAALEWGFEAATNQNETFAFVQACIGIEAVLGEELDAETGLTRQLADRCAFLLGKTRADRTIMRKFFSELYRTRSKLVHGKAVRLSETDQTQATRLLEDLVKIELASFVREDRSRKKEEASAAS